jgi:lysozyme
MNDGLTLSSEGGALVRSFEGCLHPIDAARTQYRPYVCPAGVLSIGFGHTNDNGRKFTSRDTWTKGECDAEFRADMRRFEAAVRRRVKVALTQHEFDALVSFTYNCGEGNLAKSTLLRKVNAKDFEGAANEFAKWNRGGGRVLNGLTRRRAAEAALFRDGDHAAAHTSYQAAKHADPDGHEPMPQRVDLAPGSAKPMAESKIGNTQIAIGAAGAAEAAAKAKDALDQANSIKEGAKDLGVLDVLEQLASSPMFWVAVAIVVGAGFAWYWRRQHAQNGV